MARDDDGLRRDSGKGVGVSQRMKLDSRLHTASVFKWAKRLPRTGVVMAEAWLSAIEGRLARSDLSDQCIATLKRIMIEDVRSQLAEFSAMDFAVVTEAGRKRAAAVEAAWQLWYPTWVRSCLCDLERLQPELFVTEGEARRLQSRRDSALNAKVVKAHRVTAAAVDLLALVTGAPNGVVLWEPEVVAKALRPRARNDQPPKVRHAADLLVRLGVAEWRTRANGHPWALAATGRRLEGATT